MQLYCSSTQADERVEPSPDLNTRKEFFRYYNPRAKVLYFQNYFKFLEGAVRSPVSVPLPGFMSLQAQDLGDSIAASQRNPNWGTIRLG
ncbi:hypothetical protein H6G20_05255 [Desertifilum sp. FACHB-1129]|uniref:hypothetical protein n=1 Tax=unclassified Desertifilum TaxID=2621682 RepID=UPI0016881D22|nr:MULTISPECIES: hypothetical protein [unclassified Desertifilum]MBD2311093.1 hypothetical protein [Desertifilum sp. FACHB-1129]MBD2323960.1 hypothetical protein [Desertifilum sp. FACHB-866]MBD2333895.1 hypothetical protein [Desertifilum sp. FACHB-868]MDA0211206.1 hypothetical protein [Cyanobacteria bacterium FC1]